MPVKTPLLDMLADRKRLLPRPISERLLNAAREAVRERRGQPGKLGTEVANTFTQPLADIQTRALGEVFGNIIESTIGGRIGEKER